MKEYNKAPRYKDVAEELRKELERCRHEPDEADSAAQEPRRRTHGPAPKSHNQRGQWWNK